MPRNERAQWARLDLEGVPMLADLAAGLSLARVLDFHGPQLHCFGAPAALSVPLVVEGFNGRVINGASCNCSVVTLTPHANGTHTEGVGHLTVEPLDVHQLLPQRLLLAALLSVTPERLVRGESVELLITPAQLDAAWPGALHPRLLARAAIIRTLPNERHKFNDDPAAAPYLAPGAASELVERGIEHLVLDVPSADRASDGGELAAHRIFFGLPPGSTQLRAARRPASTITELAFIGDTIGDGWYLLSLQAPALGGDAVPSRPVLYPLRAA